MSRSTLSLHLRAIPVAALAAVVFIGGCENTYGDAQPVGSIAGSYVLRTASHTAGAGNPLWKDHIASVGDTFHAAVSAGGVLTIQGLRVNGYATGTTLTAVEGPAYTGGNAAHPLASGGQPAFFASYSATDTYRVATSPLALTITSTTTGATPTLADSVRFLMVGRPTIDPTSVTTYRLTTSAGSSDTTTDFTGRPINGAVIDAELNGDGTLSIDATGQGSEDVVLYASAANALSGQYTVFDDAVAASNRTVSVTLTLSGSVPKVATAAGIVIAPIAAVGSENYVLVARSMAQISALAPSGTYRVFSTTGDDQVGNIPVDYADLVDRIDDAHPGGAGVNDEVFATIQNHPTLGVILGIDANNDAAITVPPSALDEVFPLGYNGSTLIFADKRDDLDTPASDYEDADQTIVTYTLTPAGAAGTYAVVLQFQGYTSTGVTVPDASGQIAFTLQTP